MRRMVLRISVAVLTFALGVSLATLYLARDATPAGQPSTEGLEKSVQPKTSSCFPGLSVNAQVTDRLSHGLRGKLPAKASQSEWYAKHLAALGEPPLYFCNGGVEESYRFLWLRTFHHPVVVRIWKWGGAQFLNVKELDGAGGYAPGKLILNRTRELTADEWDEFTNLVEQSCYWRMPSEDEDLTGMDGAQWILEGIKQERAHVVDRWTPRSGSYHELCLYLLKLSELEIDANDLY